MDRGGLCVYYLIVVYSTHLSDSKVLPVGPQRPAADPGPRPAVGRPCLLPEPVLGAIPKDL